MSSSGTGLGADLQGAKPEAGQYGKREKDRIEKCVREKKRILQLSLFRAVSLEGLAFVLLNDSTLKYYSDDRGMKCHRTWTQQAPRSPRLSHPVRWRFAPLSLSPSLLPSLPSLHDMCTHVTYMYPRVCLCAYMMIMTMVKMMAMMMLGIMIIIIILAVVIVVVAAVVAVVAVVLVAAVVVVIDNFAEPGGKCDANCEGSWKCKVLGQGALACTVCVCVCMYACMYACMHVCMHACMYAYK